MRIVLALTVVLAAAVVAVGLAPSSQGAAPGYGLRWDAPELERPQTVVVTPQNTVLRLHPRRDYRIVLRAPLRQPGGLQIIGGRNVVLVGGRITIAGAGPRATGNARRALLLAEQTGVVHVEGLLIDNSGGDLAEGIQIGSPRATVQLQNVRITRIHARDEQTFTDAHPDLVQVYGGVRRLRIHNFSGVTRYQGLFLRPTRGRIGAVSLSRVNITGEGPARVLLWKRCLRGYPAPCEGEDFPMTLRDVWAQPAPGRTFYDSVKPAAEWRGVRRGLPPGGPYVSVDGLHARYRVLTRPRRAPRGR